MVAAVLRRALIVAAVLFLLGVVAELANCGLAGVWTLDPKHTDWATTGAIVAGVGAWAQLVAAIAGVFVAYWIGRQELRNARLLSQAELAQTVDSIQAIANEVARLARDVSTQLGSDAVWLPTPDFEDYGAALAGFELTRLPRADAIVAVRALIRTCEKAPGLIRSLNSQLNGSPRTLTPRDRADLAEWEKRAEAARDTLLELPGSATPQPALRPFTFRAMRP